MEAAKSQIADVPIFTRLAEERERPVRGEVRWRLADLGAAAAREEAELQVAKLTRNPGRDLPWGWAWAGGHGDGRARAAGMGAGGHGRARAGTSTGGF